MRRLRDVTQKPQSLLSMGLRQLGSYGSNNRVDQELTVEALDHSLDLCRVKGRETALGEAVVRSEHERGKVH